MSSSELGDVKAIAVSAVSEFIGSGDVFHFDLHASPAVKQLENDEQYAPLFQLLMLLLNGDVQVFCSFTDFHISKTRKAMSFTSLKINKAKIQCTQA